MARSALVTKYFPVYLMILPPLSSIPLAIQELRESIHTFIIHIYTPRCRHSPLHFALVLLDTLHERLSIDTSLSTMRFCVTYNVRSGLTNPPFFCFLNYLTIEAYGDPSGSHARYLSIFHRDDTSLHPRIIIVSTDH